MEERTFKPGIYTHFKEGTKYFAYEDTTDEETQLPRISYITIDKPLEKWNRKQEVFLALADQDETNKTGQEFKFEYFSNQVPLFIRPTRNGKKMLEAQKQAFLYLHVDDTIRIVKRNGESPPMFGRIEAIGYFGIYIDMEVAICEVPWIDIQELYKVFLFPVTEEEDNHAKN